MRRAASSVLVCVILAGCQGSDAPGPQPGPDAAEGSAITGGSPGSGGSPGTGGRADTGGAGGMAPADAAPLEPDAGTDDAAPPAGTAVKLFDGTTLDGWDGNPKIWSVKEGAIDGLSTTGGQ